MSFGKNLKFLMEFYEVSDDQLAKALKVDLENIRVWKKNKDLPDFNILNLIAKNFLLDRVEWLMEDHKMRTYRDVGKLLDDEDEITKKSKLKERKCLSCDVKFMSEGPHIRKCDKCRDVLFPTGTEEKN